MSGPAKRSRTHTPDRFRPLVAFLATIVALAIIALLHTTLPDKAAKVLLDRGGLHYPFSVQNAMWIAFCIGLGEIVLRYLSARSEAREMRQGYLPEDDRTVLQGSDLKDIYRKVRSNPTFEARFLPRLIDRCILQFQASSSVDQSASLLNTSLEMFIHEVDLRYNMLRYLCWAIPSFGFIGTVIGIGHALSYAGEPGRFQDPALLSEVTSRLAVSFDGTLLALVMASILLFCQTIVQSKEEHALNQAGQYCLDNLINRLYVPK